MLRRLLAACSGVLMLACGDLRYAVPTYDGYKQMMNTWTGGDADELVRKWGPPQETFQMPNGNTLFIYRETRRETEDARATTTVDQATGQRTTTFHPAQTRTHGCVSQFEVSSDQRIVSWRYEGEDCKALATRPKPAPPPPASGSYLGVELQEVTQDVASALKLDEPIGVLVTGVLKDSPADGAGLQNNDIIVNVAGRRMHSVAQLRQTLHDATPGQSLDLDILRMGNAITLTAFPQRRARM